MATPTYTPLATITLTSSSSSVTFSSIPATYRDLVLVASPISSTTSNLTTNTRFNSDSGSNYSFVLMRGDGSSATSTSGTATGIQGIITRANTVRKSLTIMQIMDYSATNKHKSVISRVDAEFATQALAERWANTAAITSINISVTASSFGVGTSFELYGIAA